MTLTKEQIQKYLKSPDHCPKCGAEHDDVFWGLVDDDCTGLHRENTCAECDFEWNDVLDGTVIKIEEG